MLEVAVTYFVLAYLVCWGIDLIAQVLRSPVTMDPVLKMIVVVICVALVLYCLAEHRWLLG